MHLYSKTCKIHRYIAEYFQVQQVCPAHTDLTVDTEAGHISSSDGDGQEVTEGFTGRVHCGESVLLEELSQRHNSGRCRVTVHAVDKFRVKELKHLYGRPGRNRSAY